MLAGVRIIPRDQIDKGENLSAPGKEKQKQKKRSGNKENKCRKEKKRSHSSSSDGEELDRIKKGSKKKWYSSDEYSSSSSYSSGVESEGSSDQDRRRSQSRKKGKRRTEDDSEDEASYGPKRRLRRGRKEYVSEDHYSSASDGKDIDSSDRKERCKNGSKKDRKKKSKQRSLGGMGDGKFTDGDREPNRLKDGEIARKEFGLEWMLRPEGKTDRTPTVNVEEQPKETLTEEIKVNPRELNPYLKDDGSGYPEDTDEPKAAGNQLLSSSVVGDGGASWKLKALKRAKEQATREGRRLQEVVGERWGSLGQLTVSMASNKAAQSRAHLQAIRSRQKGPSEERQPDSSNQSDKDNKKDTSRHYLKDVSCGLTKMREPKVQDKFSWIRRGVSTQDSSLLADSVASLNKFSNDGSFMSEVLHKRTDDFSGHAHENIAATSKPSEATSKPSEATSKPSEVSAAFHELSANQLAAKAFQLRMKGKLEEAEELLQEVENRKAKQASGDNSVRPGNEQSTSRHVMQEMNLRQKKKEDDADMHLAQRITQNKKYSISGQADDEYDYDDAPRKKSKKKQGSDQKVTQNNSFATRFATQQERCFFCFELIHGLCCQGRTNNAKQLCNEMKSKGFMPSSKSYNSLVNALALHGEVEEALKYLWEMIENQRSAEFITYKTILDEICRLGRVGEAMKLLKEFEEKDLLNGHAYRKLLYVLEDDYGDPKADAQFR